MISDYAFKMVVEVLLIKYTGYYVHKSGRRFKLVGIIREGINTPTYYLQPKERRLDHMDPDLSYDALNTRAKRAITYNVERVKVKDIQSELDTLEQEMVLRAL